MDEELPQWKLVGLWFCRQQWRTKRRTTGSVMLWSHKGSQTWTQCCTLPIIRLRNSVLWPSARYPPPSLPRRIKTSIRTDRTPYERRYNADKIVKIQAGFKAYVLFDHMCKLTGFRNTTKRKPNEPDYRGVSSYAVQTSSKYDWGGKIYTLIRTISTPRCSTRSHFCLKTNHHRVNEGIVKKKLSSNLSQLLTLMFVSKSLH